MFDLRAVSHTHTPPLSTSPPPSALDATLPAHTLFDSSVHGFSAFSALTLLVGRQKGHRPVQTEWWGAGVVICLERVADLHMSHLMPLPLTVSCFSKIQIGFTFLVLAHPGSPGKRSVKRVCVHSSRTDFNTNRPNFAAANQVTSLTRVTNERQRRDLIGCSDLNWVDLLQVRRAQSSSRAVNKPSEMRRS